MRIVDLKTFLTMPRGTLYHKWKPCVTDSYLEMKNGNCGERDYFYANMTGVSVVDNTGSGDLMDKFDAMEKGESRPASFDSIGRDGCFEDRQLYLIYERTDVEALIRKLQDSLDPEKMKGWE